METQAELNESGAGRRRRLAPDDRREELIAAALRVLRSEAHSEEGVNWVAVVTAEAGAAKGTFYRYFPSWEAMLGTVRDRLLAGFHAPLKAALDSDHPQDWWRLLIVQCDRLVDDALAYPRHHRMIFHAPLPDRPIDPAVSGAELLAGVLRAGAAAGQFRAVADPEATATLLLSGMHTVADVIVAEGERERWTTAFAVHAAGVVGIPASAGSGRRP